MELKTKSIRGTRDITPAEIHKWQYIERVAIEVAKTFGANEIRIPTIEKTALFVRSVGETTDVVQKEMYTFEKGRESITLRPEGTAGTVRAVLENNLTAETLPVKLCYIISCFRHENPQAGRLREFHQFGVEYFGSRSPSADAEVINIASNLFARLGVTGLSLEINSIGCPDCRPQYNQKLVDFYRAHLDLLCDTCKERLEKNPLRLLDCKEEACSKLAKAAPIILDNLCEECSDHFVGVKRRLDAVSIAYTVNPYVVRGLDYYTKTVFEFVSQNIGAQGTVCGGGRYDLLIEQMGGAPTPSLGFAMGLERLIMLMDATGCDFPSPALCDVFIGSMGEEADIKALEIAAFLRQEGFYAECDLLEKSVKAQMKYANKIGALNAFIIGSDELSKGVVKVKEMATGKEREIALDGKAIADYLYENLSNPDSFSPPIG